MNYQMGGQVVIMQRGKPHNSHSVCIVKFTVSPQTPGRIPLLTLGRIGDRIWLLNISWKASCAFIFHQ